MGKHALEKYYIESIKMGIATQRYYVQGQWEPGITHALGSVADDCLKTLRRQLPEHQGGGFILADHGWQIRVRAELARITAERTEVVKELLVDMVTEVARDTGEILTINGLAADLPGLAALHPDPNAAASRLAGGAVLDQTVGRSFVEFCKRAFSAINAAGREKASRPELVLRLQGITGAWRTRLETIACTVLHAAYNRTKHAAGAALTYPPGRFHQRASTTVSPTANTRREPSIHRADPPKSTKMAVSSTTA